MRYQHFEHSVAEPKTSCRLTPLEVRGNSMVPMILDGATVWAEPIADHRFSVGDLVTYLNTGNRLVTHRILEIHSRGACRRLVVRGDNAAHIETVAPSNVAYRITNVDNGLFSYDVDGPIGRLSARIAKAERLRYKCLRSVVKRLWNCYHFMQMDSLFISKKRRF